MRAWFAGVAFARHRHDTYAIGLTESGVQSFGYRGSAHVSTPGKAVVLHPDEPHDGYAGTEDGFGYRIIYAEPARIAEALRAIAGRSCALPFVCDPVLKSAKLARAIEAAFACELVPLALDAILLRLAEALLEEAAGGGRAARGEGRAARVARLDLAAIERARQLLDGATTRVVRSSELEAASGLSRYDLARQFRARVGTSPYRYSLMRRLEFVRDRLGAERSTADLALEAGFSDQAHFTRFFKRAFGVTPVHYGMLKRRGAAKEPHC